MHKAGTTGYYAAKVAINLILTKKTTNFFTVRDEKEDGESL